MQTILSKKAEILGRAKSTLLSRVSTYTDQTRAALAWAVATVKEVEAMLASAKDPKYDEEERTAIELFCSLALEKLLCAKEELLALERLLAKDMEMARFATTLIELKHIAAAHASVVALLKAIKETAESGEGRLLTAEFLRDGETS